MSKYWALVISYRPGIYSLGKHNTFDAAEAMALDFCEKNNTRNRQAYDEQVRQNQNPEVEIPEPAPYQLAYIMDDNDMRHLTGLVHRPYVIAKQREVVEVTAPTRQGAPAPQAESDEGGAEETQPEPTLNGNGHHNDCNCGVCRQEI